MVHNKVFEDGRKAKDLEVKLLDLCELADEKGVIATFGGSNQVDIHAEIKKTYSDYAELMNKYNGGVPENIQIIYDQALNL